jgi:hypothetical protein
MPTRPGSKYHYEQRSRSHHLPVYDHTWAIGPRIAAQMTSTLSSAGAEALRLGEDQAVRREAPGGLRNVWFRPSSDPLDIDGSSVRYQDFGVVSPSPASSVC